MQFLEKYVRIKIGDHKILVLMSQLSSKLDKVNASYACKYNSVLWDFRIFYQFTAYLCTFLQSMLESKLKIIKFSFLWVYIHRNKTNLTQKITLNILECLNWETSVFNYIYGDFLHWVCPISMNFHSLE